MVFLNSKILKIKYRGTLFMKEHFCEFSLSRKHYERKIVANLIKQWNTQYLTLVDLFEQFDKPYYYHAEIIFFFFISCQTKFNSNLLIQLYLHFITLYGNLYGNCFK